jgi:hypothetical protein
MLLLAASPCLMIDSVIAGLGDLEKSATKGHSLSTETFSFLSTLALITSQTSCMRFRD